MSGFDLHIHTNASDGIFTTNEIIDLAFKKGLEGIAITDHDTVQGIQNLASAKNPGKISLIPGIELSTEYQDREIHILGYLFDPESLPFLDLLEQVQNARRQRIFKIVDKLNQLGYDVDIAEVESAAGFGSVGRPHVAYVLVQKGLISSVEEAFTRLIGRGCPAYVPRYKLSPFEAVKIIKTVGGIPVMAHPGLAQADYLIPELMEYGLRGLEAFHPDHTPEEEKKYLVMAERSKSVITGGSDFHGFKEGTRFSIGSKTVSARHVRQLYLLKNAGEKS